MIEYKNWSSKLNDLSDHELASLDLILNEFATRGTSASLGFEVFLGTVGYREDGAIELLQKLVSLNYLKIIGAQIGLGEIGLVIFTYLVKKKKEEPQKPETGSRTGGKTGEDIYDSELGPGYTAP